MDNQDIKNRQLISALIGLFCFGGPLPAIFGYKFASKGWGSAFLGWVLGAVLTVVVVLGGYAACIGGLMSI